MKKRKISLIIIAIAMALCMALCVFLPACSGGGDDGDVTPPESTTDPEGGDENPDDGNGDGSEDHTTHSYTVLKSDSTGHWYECECGEKDESTFAAHNSTDADGAVAYDSDGTQHWEICAVCGYVTGEKTACTTDETAYQSDRNNHWHTCKVCGGEMDKGAHDTNGDDGACSICGYVKTELTSTTVYMVGDSTMCSFNDAYYYPRYGYGTQVPNYLDEKATVVNLAVSGRSSKSFLTESNYTTLTSSITSGDYLIIGFGHNDEKYDDSTRFTSPELDAVETTGSFQNSLYYNYVKVALDVGATPILCTPIVRLNSSNTYTGNNAAHVVSGYGDYSACIRDLADDYNITCVDLTTLTGNLYSQIGYDEALYYHAWTTENPLSVDTTHLNIYGAKQVAYMFAEALSTTTTKSGLEDYVLDGITAPDKDTDLTPNPDYSAPEYTTPDLTSQTALGQIGDVSWYGTAFGDTGSKNIDNQGFVHTVDESGKVTVGRARTSEQVNEETGVTETVASNNGKITSSDEGISMVFTQLEGKQQFSISATVTVTKGNSDGTTGTSAVSQSGFGIMLRDDIYIDTYDKTIMTNYVASGLYMSGSSTTKAIYSRVNSIIVNSSDETENKTTNNSISSAYKVGDTYTIELSRYGGAQTTECKITSGNTTYTYIYYDFDYVATDYEYCYLGFYATRGTVVEFTNITYTPGEVAQA